MGREERCDGDCSEHKLLLVTAAEYDELLGAAHAARVRAARMVAVVGSSLRPTRRRTTRVTPSEDARKRPSGAARRRTRR